MGDDLSPPERGVTAPNAFDDAQIVARIRTGDREAFESLYLATFAELWGAAYRFVRSQDVAQDVVQDVFLSIWSNRERWSVRTSVRAYLYRAVRNRVTSYTRHRTMAQGAHNSFVALGESPGMGAETAAADEQVALYEDAQALQSAIRALPERQRVALSLWLDQRSLAEIAEIMDITTVSVWNLLAKGRRALAKAIDLS